ncbi:OmpA family protein [uncultured Jatrophihabitans sp.]|uniref:OmpA family protein n=1 Tax=uncultured Jatrophihabitans sp. TaxID=1610747 RepID=UPI0035CB541F
MTARNLRVGVSVLAAAATLSAAAVVLDASPAVAAPASPAHASPAHASPTHASPARAAWFHDPVSAKARRAEAHVRGHHWGGRLRHTTATYRAHDGKLAVPARWAVGHTLTRGEALVLDGAALFTFNSAHVTAAARREIRELRGAFADVRGVRVEGYADFGGRASNQQRLSAARARAIRRLLVHVEPNISARSIGYGGHRPVVVGGTPSRRAANRRVIIEVTRVRTPAPPAPLTAPPAPHISAASATDTVTFSFSEARPRGTSKVTGYQLSTDGGTTWQPLSVTGHSPFTVTLSGPHDANTYRLAVRALSAAGASPASNVVTVSFAPATAPGAPTVASVSGVWDGAFDSQDVATVDFSPPASDGGSPITGYQLSVDSGPYANTIYVAGSPYVTTTLVYSNCSTTTHTFAVRAVNAQGPGAVSNTVSQDFETDLYC